MLASPRASSAASLARPKHRARPRGAAIAPRALDDGSSSSELAANLDRWKRLDHEPDSAFGAHGLGAKKIWRGRRVLAFAPARKFVWHLHLRNRDEWDDWKYNSRRGCVFIPREPDEAYALDGWAGWDDWLGITVDFETARAWARQQGFKSQQDWWARTSELPHRIPERPGQLYRDVGWKGYADFLGIEEVVREAPSER